jgi:type I restriction enzyme S subunit
MEGRELPVGWDTARLEEVTEILDSRRIPLNADARKSRIEGKEEDELFPYYGATGQVGWIDDFLFDEQLILLGEDGVPFFDPLRHKAYLVSGRFWVNNHAHVLRGIAGLADHGYLTSYLNQLDYTGFVSGSTRLKLTQAAMRGIPVPLAPLNEQRRIAAKLDTTLAAVETCRQRLDGVAAILKRFRQAVLAAATSGELTREWREERGAPEWDTQSLGDCGAVTGGITKNSSRPSLPVQKPYLRVANVYLNRIDLDDVSVIGVTEAEYRKTALRSGDLLIVEGNGSLQQVGRVAIWESTELDCVHQNHLIRWRSDGMMPKWALYWLMSPVGRQLLEQRAKSTTGLHTLSVSKVSGIPIPVPSIAEQDEIISRAQHLFTLADQLEARLNAARKIVDRLTPALLAKAFRGELVPQDSNDEPASVLLERVAATRRAARQAEAGAGKPSRRGRPKAAANPDQLPLDAAPVPPDFLAGLLRECGALSERALLAVSELEPERFEQQLFRELERGTAREVQADGQVLLEAVG